jgi:hypothetical protein
MSWESHSSWRNCLGLPDAGAFGRVDKDMVDGEEVAQEDPELMDEDV